MVGDGFFILNMLGVEFNFYPYSSEYEPGILPLLNSVSAYIQPDVNTYILMVNQSLDIIYD